MAADPNLLLHLTCQTCYWRPEGEHTVGVMKAHVETEHPEQVNDDGEPALLFELVARCLRCDTPLDEFGKVDMGTHYEINYRCPKDHRSYRLRQAK